MHSKNCANCLHKEDKTEQHFFCKLHDIFYAQNQEHCEDFESLEEDQESDTYACD